MISTSTPWTWAHTFMGSQATYQPGSSVGGGQPCACRLSGVRSSWLHRGVHGVVWSAASFSLFCTRVSDSITPCRRNCRVTEPRVRPRSTWLPSPCPSHQTEVPPAHPPFHSFIHSSIHSFIHPFIHSSTHSFIHSFLHPFIHSSILWYHGNTSFVQELNLAWSEYQCMT